jgi:hypothetical protein
MCYRTLSKEQLKIAAQAFAKTMLDELLKAIDEDRSIDISETSDMLKVPLETAGGEKRYGRIPTDGRFFSASIAPVGFTAESVKNLKLSH